MEKSAKNIFSFLWPYVTGLLGIRFAMDTLIKQMHWGYQGESVGGIIALIIALGFIFLTINNYKKFSNKGQLLFSEGVRVGVGLMLLVGTLFSVYLILHGKFIDPTYQEKLAQEAALVTGANYTKTNTNVFIGLSLSILRYIFLGAFGAVISAAILKTEK